MLSVMADLSLPVDISGRETTLESVRVESPHYSHPDRPEPIFVNMASSSWFDIDAQVILSRSGDTVIVNEGLSFKDLDKSMRDIKDMVFDRLTHKLESISHSEWSDYMFGAVSLWTPNGIRRLNAYIIDLNDRDKMTREDIAQHIEDLMGSTVPRVPVIPMAWVLEDRPVEVREERIPSPINPPGPNVSIPPAEFSIPPAEFSTEGSVKPLSEILPSIKVPDKATSVSMEYDHKTMTDKYKFYDHEGKELDCLVVDKLVMDGLSLLNDEDAPS